MYSRRSIAALGVALAVALSGCGGRQRRTTAPIRPAARAPADAAAAFGAAQRTIDSPASNVAERAQAGAFEQLALGALAGHDRRRGVDSLTGNARTQALLDLDAQRGLASISGSGERPTLLPRWRIVAPPPAATLMHDYLDSARRYGIPWQVLAAIELIETRFGRIAGPSSAGALGPMQFMPATWAQYGRGRITDQRDSIAAAARYLAANGARTRLPRAIYAYNRSSGYVRAVLDYVHAMRLDPRAYYGYRGWRVIYAVRGRDWILSEGYPRVRARPLIGRP